MSQAIEIILFALLAAYMFFRLWSVLGQRTGNESEPEKWEAPEDNKIADISSHSESDRGKVIPLRPDQDVIIPSGSEQAAAVNPAIQNGIREIAKLDPSFHIGHFAEGARLAFDMVIKAYASVDKDKLKELLSDSVLKKFSKVMDQRQVDGQILEVEIKSINVAEIESVKVVDGVASIAIKFVSEQMVATIEKNGDINDNPAKLYVPMTDVWTFSRDLSSKNPNWSLSATKSQSS